MTLFRQSSRLILFLMFTLALIPCQWIAKKLYPSDKYIVARFWHRNALRLCGIHVQRIGDVARGSVLFLSNHVSYLDISVLGGVIDTCFVSKKEVKKWPLFGLLAKLQDTVFIDRARTKNAIESSRSLVQEALSQNRRITVFPEGTNSIGNVVLPFKRALLEDLNAQEYQIQPVSIRVLDINGKSLDALSDFEVYGWGDIEFIPHFWRLLGQKSLTIQVQILAPFALNNNKIIFDDIKQAEEAIALSLDLKSKTTQNTQDALVAQQDRATVS